MSDQLPQDLNFNQYGVLLQRINALSDLVTQNAIQQREAMAQMRQQHREEMDQMRQQHREEMAQYKADAEDKETRLRRTEFIGVVSMFVAVIVGIVLFFLLRVP